MSFSDYFENQILNHIFGHSVYAFQGHWLYLGLGVFPTDSVVNELPDVNGYTRVITVPNEWSDCINGMTSNVQTITFDQATGDWGEVTHFLIFDTLVVGTGNLLMYGGLTVGSVNIEEDSIPKFETGALACSIN